jgi:alpha-glucosidase
MGNSQVRFNDQIIRSNSDKGSIQLSVVTPQIVRVQIGEGQAEHSYAVEPGKMREVPVEVSRTGGVTSVRTSDVQVKVSASGFVDMYAADGTPIVRDYRGGRTPLPRMTSAEQQALMEAEGHRAQSTNSDAALEVIKQLQPGEHFYGLGDKTGFLDKRGYAYDNWNTDEGIQLESTPKLYKSIPFVIGLNSDAVYGIFFDNTYASHVDLGKESSDYFFYSADGGAIDYYLIGGKNMAEVVSNYTYLTGRTPLPQKWTLGYQQSRWGYINEQEVRSIAAKMRELDIPCDAIHLDIDYMDGYRVFTTNHERFPDLLQLTDELRAQGIKIVTIIDPGVKKDSRYSVYRQGKAKGYFATTPEEDTYINSVWPGKSAFPDFGRPQVREWWGNNQKFLIDRGVAGVWNDMNEPASFDGPLPDGTVFYDEDKPSTIQQMHNVYGHNMSRATFEGRKRLTGKRPFTISRAVYAGTQKFSTVWTGDNRSSWDHLRMSIPQLCNLGVSGFSFAGSDIGGFLDDSSAELMSRWIEAAMFSPLFRNHSCIGTRLQEPWQFGEPTLSIYRKYVKLRYQLLDYIYDLFASGERDGLPIMRPLVMHYGNDPETATINDEFLVGESLLVAPVVTPGTDRRLVYLPEGKWCDYWTGKQFEGKQHIVVEAPLDYLPLFVKGNSILPLRPDSNFVDVAAEKSLTFRLWGEKGSYVHYQDDGESYNYQNGAYNEYVVSLNEVTASVELKHHGYEPVYQTIEVLTPEASNILTFDPELKTYR